MASDYPGALDTFVDPTPSSPRNNPSVANTTVKIHDAIEAIQATLGTTATAVAGFRDTIEEITGTTYTSLLADLGKTKELNNAAAFTYTIPPNASVAFVIGDRLGIRQTGAGQVTVVGGSGVAVNGAGGALKLSGQWSEGVLTKRATNTWILVGDITT